MQKSRKSYVKYFSNTSQKYVLYFTSIHYKAFE